MAKITLDQMQFLQQQSISLSRVFDASGMPRSVYEQAMIELEMIVAIGVSPCRKAGHTLRTPAGHCAQCNTHALGFLRRHYETGEVYVAVSEKTDLIKIGSAKCSKERMNTLNRLGYGGASDWSIHWHDACNKAGKVEFIAQNILNEHRTSRTYIKNGKPVDCQELFNCSASIAEVAVQSAMQQV